MLVISDFKARQDSWEVKHFRTAYPEFARKTLKLASMSAAPDAVCVNSFRKLRAMILLDPATSGLALSLVDAAGRLVD